MRFYCKQHKTRVRDFESCSLMGARIVLCKVRRRYPYAKLFTEDGVDVSIKQKGEVSS